MSHEIESLVYVRQVPWHGLGTKVEEAQSSKEAIKTAGLDWKVIQEDIKTENNIIIPNYKANIRDIDDKVLGIVTNRYEIIQNEEAFSFTDLLIGDNCKYECAGSLFGGKKIFLLAKMPEKKILEESYEPYLCFTNTHDGSGSIKVCLTPIRVVCNNTVNLAFERASRSWSTRHIGDISTKLQEAEITLQLTNNYMNELEKVSDQLAHTKFTEDETNKLLEELFPINEDDGDRRKRNIADTREQFMICMFAPDLIKYKGTAYQVMQAASDFATHTAPKRISNSFKENNFNNILNGHIVIDKTFEKLMQKVNKNY